MRLQPTIKIVEDTDYDPENSGSVQEIIDHEKAGLDSKEFEAYGIEIYLGSEEIHSCYGYVASAGYIGEYDNYKEIGDSFLADAAAALVGQASNMAEVVSFYIVASSAASARWSWEANLKNGSHAIMSDDKDFAETEARYESMRWRQRKGKDISSPDHYRPYKVDIIIKEA